MELYHASKEIVQYPEIRKTKYTRIFHGDSIALATTNKPKKKKKKAGLVVLSTCLNIQNLPC